MSDKAIVPDETQRNQFAAAALGGLVVGRVLVDPAEREKVAALAWEMADVMLSPQIRKAWE